MGDWQIANASDVCGNDGIAIPKGEPMYRPGTRDVLGKDLRPRRCLAHALELGVIADWDAIDAAQKAAEPEPFKLETSGFARFDKRDLRFDGKVAALGPDGE